MKSVRAEILRSSLTGIEAVMSLLNKPKDAPLHRALGHAAEGVTSVMQDIEREHADGSAASITAVLNDTSEDAHALRG
jgi:hypothetical protein